MNRRKLRLFSLGFVAFLVSLILSIALPAAVSAHWADLSVAEVVVGETTSQMTLTFPTGLVAFADDNGDSQLSATEVQSHQAELVRFLGDRIRLTDSKRHLGSLTVTPSDAATLSPSLKASPGSHSTLQLLYTWPQPIQGIQIHYDFFLPNVPTATCLTTIVQSGKVHNVVFSPINREFSLLPGSIWLSKGGVLVTIVGAFCWGAIHAFSPGHGKMIVGAYLMGSQATPKQALFLGLTATITHTLGIFILGVVTLMATQFVLPEKLYPWISCLSGFIVFAIGLHLFIQRLQKSRQKPHELRRSIAALSPEFSHTAEHSHTPKQDGHIHTHNPIAAHSHSHTAHSHSHDVDKREAPAHDYAHSHSLTSSPAHPTHFHPHSTTGEHNHEEHIHEEHTHGGHTHSHLPPNDGSPVTWRSLLALGISGGILPCPSALVLLLSAVSLGQISLGLSLVAAFSLGLAGVLTGLGLLLIYMKRWFDRLPNQFHTFRMLPIASALVVTILGAGMITKSFMEIGLLRF